MRSLITIGAVILVLNFCGLSERFKQITGKEDAAANTSPGNSAQPGPNVSLPSPDKASLTPEQQAVVDSATEMAWDDQGIVWKLPKGWKKTDSKKETAIFSSPDGAFLIPTVSVMRDDFPLDVALGGAFTSANMQARNGKYETVRYVEIDGVTGIETIETMPQEKGDPRRHQWIGFRKYNGQTQQVNIILSTKGNNFDKYRVDFPAILYSMKLSD